MIDLRRGTFKGPPKEPDPSGSYLEGAITLCGDHGGPTWPNYFFYHNTVLRGDTSWRGYYGFGMGGQGTRATQRRVFNNISFSSRDNGVRLAVPREPDMTLSKRENAVFFHSGRRHLVSDFER